MGRVRVRPDPVRSTGILLEAEPITFLLSGFPQSAYHQHSNHQ
jgi:hypothetical protein